MGDDKEKNKKDGSETSSSYDSDSSSSSYYSDGHETKTNLGHDDDISKSFSVKAVMRKNWHFQKRQRKTLGCQVCCPLFVMALLVFLNYLFNNVLIEREKFKPEIIDYTVSDFRWQNNPGMGVYLANEAGSDTGSLDGPVAQKNQGTGLLGMVPQNQVAEMAAYVAEPHVLEELGNSDKIDGEFANQRDELIRWYRNSGFDFDAPQEYLTEFWACSGFYSGFVSPPNDTASGPFPEPGEPCPEVPGYFEGTSSEAANYMEELIKFPAGGWVIKDHDSSKFDYSVVVGNVVEQFDVNFQYLSTIYAYSWKSAADRAVNFAANLNNAYARYYINDTINISGGFKNMPYETTEPPDIDIPSLMASVLFPFVVSLIIPLFVQGLVNEKENKLREMMKMMGLTVWKYWAINYLFHFTLYAVMTSVFIIAGLAFGLAWFRETGFGIYFLLFVLWGTACIATAYFITAFFGKTLKAVVFTYILIIASVITSNVLNSVSFCEKQAPDWYLAWPMFACYRGIYLISIAAGGVTNAAPLTAANIVPGTEMARIYGFLAWESVVYILAAFYLEAILPKKVGIRRPWYFPVTDLYTYFRYNVAKTQDVLDDAAAEEMRRAQEEEDSDVHAERERVHATDVEGGRSTMPAVLVKELRKEYGGFTGDKKLALKDPCLRIDYGECFGLLGPNGAGKSTMISILTGLYMPTAGDAWIAGFNIKTNMTDIHHRLGVCPQHDTLWEDLTVQETLTFYARLKGVPTDEEKDHVADRIREMDLTGKEHALISELSGGMMRRVSIAIALTGGSRIIFLDEPTTGLDPETKHHIWEVIQAAKENRCILLTTHSMEEADVLCTRIGILSQGRMVCLGSQQHLKTKFGNGFKLKINAQLGRLQEAQKYILSVIPAAMELNTFESTSTYQIKKEDMKLSKVFAELDSNAHDHGIDDWGMSQTSLEEVFLSLVSEADAAGR